MKFNVLILSNKVLTGQQDIKMPELLSCFYKTGNEVLTIRCEKFSKEICKQEIEKMTESLIVLADNQILDDVIVDNIQLLGNDKQMVDDLAVIFNKQDKKIVFLPVDLDFQPLLNKIMESFKDNDLKYCKFHLFGKHPSQVEEGLKGLGLQDLTYSVLGENLLSDIYASYKGANNLIDDQQVKIAGCFRDNIYSENDLDLSQIVYELLRLKNLRIAIKEDVTGGKILARLCEENNGFNSVLSAGQVVKEETQLQPENIYHDAYTYLKDTVADVVLVVRGKFSEKGLNCLIALGDKNSIHVYNNKFNADRKDCLEMATNCALFHLVKKLRQNDFAF